MSLQWNRVTRVASQWYRFFAFIGQHLIIDGGIYQAAALSFTSLLAIVPLMSVSFSALSVFPIFQDIIQQIQNFVFQHFVPATGETVKVYLQQFVEQAASLSLGGVVFLIVSAVAMLFTIEQVFNQIWQVKQRRNGVAAFLLYWAVLTLGPLLLGLSILVSSYLGSLPFLAETVANIGTIKAGLLAFAPFLLTVIAFSLLYIVVPNTKVSFYYGVLGAVIAAVLLEITKLCFSLYIQQFHTYELLYGAFATIPIFFFWVYLVWVIVLLGAEITFALSASYVWRVGPQLDPFTHALCWLYYFWQEQQNGQGLSIHELIARDTYGYQQSPFELIRQLVDRKLICRTSNGAYVLSRELSELNMATLYELLPWKIPSVKDIKPLKKLPLKGLEHYLQSLEAITAAPMATPVVDLFVPYESRR